MFYILLMGNHLDSCKEDIIRLKKVFENENVTSFTDCHPLKILPSFLSKITINDSIFIYFSGHGKIIGRRIDNKMQMLSTWINHDGSYIDSYTIDKILSSITCQKIFLISDSCHSGNFGNFYTGKTPLIFIGSSSIIDMSTEYKHDSKKPAGILTYLFEKYNILYSEENIESLINIVYKEHKIKKKAIIKKFNF